MPQYRKEHKKVRTGCTTCKTRHLKCDEAKPVCMKCKKGKHECHYESVIPRRAPPKRVSVKAESSFAPVFSSAATVPSTELGIPSLLVSTATFDPSIYDMCKREIVPYGFYSDITYKLNRYMLTEFHKHLAGSKQAEDVFREAFRGAHKYEYLYHITMAAILIDLYHAAELSGTEPLLQLPRESYTAMAEFHHNKSLALMRQNLTPKEPYDALALLLSSALQMFYTTGSPDHRIADVAYIGVAKGIYLFFNDILPFLSQFDQLEETFSRYCIGSFATTPNIYFPEFLYGLLDLQYFEQNPWTPHTMNSDDGVSVSPVSESQRSLPNTPTGTFESNREIYRRVLDRLKSEFRAHAYKEKDDESPERVIEDQLVSTLARYVIDVPDQFTELIGANDPRALIIMGYHVMVLASRKYPYWSQSLYMREIDYVDDLLSAQSNGAEWKRWLNVARNAVYHLGV